MRFNLVIRQPDKAAQPVLDSQPARFATLPAELRRSITFESGTEFATTHRLADTLNMRTFFCNPHRSRRKGGTTNAAGRLRPPQPGKFALAAISQDGQRSDQIAGTYNNTPRQCLRFRITAEVFTTFLNPVALEM